MRLYYVDVLSFEDQSCGGGMQSYRFGRMRGLSLEATLKEGPCTSQLCRTSLKLAVISFLEENRWSRFAPGTGKS